MVVMETLTTSCFKRLEHPVSQPSTAERMLLLTVSKLEEVPDMAPTIADWIEHEWYRLPIHDFFDAVATRRWVRGDCLPQTLVAFQNQVPVGTASIVDRDMDIRPNWGPWLACVYVPVERRSQGIATHLIHSALRLSASLGLKALYLYTDKHASLYSRAGWRPIDTTQFEGSFVTVMLREVPDDVDSS